MAQLRFGVVTRGLVTSVEVGGDPLEDEVRVVRSMVGVTWRTLQPCRSR